MPPGYRTPGLDGLREHTLEGADEGEAFAVGAYGMILHRDKPDR
jgi:hypothetical protein